MKMSNKSTLLFNNVDTDNLFKVTNLSDYYTNSKSTAKDTISDKNTIFDKDNFHHQVHISNTDCFKSSFYSLPRKKTTPEQNIDDYIENFIILENFIKEKQKTDVYDYIKAYRKFLKKDIKNIIQAINVYKNKEISNKEISNKSLLELLRFFFSENLNKSEIYVNIDGLFVSYLKVDKNSTSLVFCENGEIIYSSNNRDLGIARASGTLTLSRNKAVKKIDKLFSFLY